MIEQLLPFLYAIIGFGLLITVHECGHFIFCKLFGVHTPTFSIGMGPALINRKIGETNFRLALIPIGGYVEIAGISEVGQGEQAFANDISERSFKTKPFWKRILILMGGVLFNLFFAYGVFSALYYYGMPIQKEVALVVERVKDENKAVEQRLHIGDTIIAVDGEKFSTEPKKLFPQLRTVSQKFAEKQAQPLKLLVDRAGKQVVVEISAEENGSNIKRGLIGGASLDIKTIKIEYERHPFLRSIRKGVYKTHCIVAQVFGSLKMLISQRNIKDFGGPIMIVSQSFKMAQKGFLLLLVFLSIISINLAVINLLPIGALDGGQILFETIEAIIRRKIPEVIRFIVNLASWVLILGLILFLSYQDILSLFLR